jgi:CHAD domain-containing protein
VAGSATLKSAFNAVWKLSRKALEAPSPDAFHKVRIRCKRFSYMLEFLQPVLPERSRGLIALMTELQDLLGDANDELALAASLTTDKTSTGDDIADQLQRSARRRQNLFKRRWRRHKDATRREVHQLLKELAKGPPEHRSA